MSKQLPTVPAEARNEERRQDKFPRISRRINEEFSVLIFCASLVILIAIIVVSISLYRNTKELKILNSEREALNREKSSWKNILSKYPDYRDGFLSLANVEYKLGDNGSALENVYKAIKIDPNFSKSYEFEKFLLNN